MPQKLTQTQIDKVVKGLNESRLHDIAQFSFQKDSFGNMRLRTRCQPHRTLPPNFHLEYNKVASEILGDDVALDYVELANP